MKVKQKNALRGIALAALVAGGTGLVRLADGARHLLEKASEVITVNVSEIKAIIDIMHEEAVGDGAPMKDTKQK